MIEFSNERADVYFLTKNTHILVLKEDRMKIAPSVSPSIYGLENASTEELLKWCLEYLSTDFRSVFKMSIYETICIELFSRLGLSNCEFKITRHPLAEFFHKFK